MTDEEWAELGSEERAFALRWAVMSEPERDSFYRKLLAAIEVLQRIGDLRTDDGPQEVAAT